jgi:hypothetical protein
MDGTLALSNPEVNGDSAAGAESEVEPERLLPGRTQIGYD